MKKFDIIMINMSSYSEWQRGVSNRNYHVLRELLANEHVGSVLAVDYPPLTLKRSIRNYKENCLSSLDNGKVIKRSVFDKVTKMSDRLYIYSNCTFAYRPESVMKKIRELAVELNFGDYVVWSYFPPAMPYLRDGGQKLTIFDAVDNWIEHSSYVSFKDRLKQNYEDIKREADVIFTVSEDLQALFDNQPNVYWIPNGVDLAHYQDEHVLLNRDIADIPKPIIGYIGVVEERVDVDLIVYLAKKNPQKSFVVVGPVWKDEDRKLLKENDNVYILGYKSYSEAPAYIQQFDVALIPHKASSFITSTNPMKLYEYLACGKPVVATKHSGAEQFKDVVYIAKDRADFNRKLYLALEENTPEKAEKRKKVVHDYSWASIVKQMIDIVLKKLEG